MQDYPHDNALIAKIMPFRAIISFTLMEHIA